MKDILLSFSLLTNLALLGILKIAQAQNDALKSQIILTDERTEDMSKNNTKKG